MVNAKITNQTRTETKKRTNEDSERTYLRTMAAGATQTLRKTLGCHRDVGWPLYMYFVSGFLGFV